MARRCESIYENIKADTKTRTSLCCEKTRSSLPLLITSSDVRLSAHKIVPYRLYIFVGGLIILRTRNSTYGDE